MTTHSRSDCPSSKPCIELLVIQPTPFCNIDCTYCYLSGRSNKRIMSAEVLERLFQRVFESPFVSDYLTVVWHAGEPLVPSVAYYDQMFAIVDRLRPSSLNVIHSFQTNGTLIDERWVNFFQRTSARVGISLDGPQRFHDRCRRTRRGDGTFHATMKGLRKLQNAGVPFHCIAVLTREALDFPEEIYAFFAGEGICQVGFNIEEIEGVHAQSSLTRDDAEAACRHFFTELLRLNEEASHPLAVRELTGAIVAILNEPAFTNNQQIEPIRILSCDVEGNLSTFSPELLGYEHERYGSFVFGSVHTHAIADILQNPRFQAAHHDIRLGVARCAEHCEYFGLCGGGAPANKLFENGSFNADETMYCRLSKKAVIDATLPTLEASPVEQIARRYSAAVCGRMT